MTQQQLADKIGVHIRTLHKWSPAKRQQWQAIVSHPSTQEYDAAFFDLYAQLAFRVAAFNAAEGEHCALVDMSRGGASLYIFRSVNEFKLKGVFDMRLTNADDIATALTELEKYA